MQIKIVNLNVSIINKKELIDIIVEKYHIEKKNIENIKIIKKSIDARKKDNILYNYILLVTLKKENKKLLENPNIFLYLEKEPIIYYNYKGKTPVIVGFGPAGMFAGLYLARCHSNPIIIERGSKIEDRKKEVALFLENKELNVNSNVQFGEGGAGTFSDGKLTTNLKDPLINFILNEFYIHGAKEDVCYLANPHVGTDYLEKVVSNIRKEIISLGGKIYFNEQFLSYEENENDLLIHTTNHEFITDKLLLCIGHSSRDTIKYLYKKGLAMEAKPFSMGVRIEHPQELINESQYGKYAKILPPANYKLAVHLKERSVYTFCMCPGGTVMASTSEKESIVTNGMSNFAREKENANAAVLVDVKPSDFVKNSPIDGLDYQEYYEHQAYLVGGDYRAPGNLMKEFLEGAKAVSIRSVKPSYPHGIVFDDFKTCLPDFVLASLKEGLPLFEKYIKGYTMPDAVLTGIETRSSSPVRIIRDKNLVANVKGIYPVGEGCGYAGGITSAALDGLKCAMLIAKENQE